MILEAESHRAGDFQAEHQMEALTDESPYVFHRMLGTKVSLTFGPKTEPLPLRTY